MTYSTWLDQDESGDYDPGADYHGREPKNQPGPALLQPASFEPISFESTSFEDAPFEPAYRRDCTACTRGRRICPYREGGDRRKPCSHCARLNQRCVVPKPRARRGTKPRLAPESGPPMSKSPAPPTCTVESSSKQEAQQLETFLLSTRLAHPIEFNFMPVREDNQIACHWCDSMVYGILGLGVINALVFDGGDGKGYVELENGHTAKGHIPSRMCIFCTTHRVRIIACKVHEMQELPRMKGVVVDQEVQARHLEHGQQDSAPFDWCSVCPHVAYYACCKSDITSDSLSPAKNDSCGCGLRLCTNCMIRMVGNHDGDLSAYLTKLFSNAEQGIGSTFGLRADADLLHPDGDLMRRARYNMILDQVTEAGPAHANGG
ncbi:hypothetical protein MMC22_000524 [Lobaria immixta]|nr:hypothetical protein [Lobaria immixta]